MSKDVDVADSPALDPVPVADNVAAGRGSGKTTPSTTRAASIESFSLGRLLSGSMSILRQKVRNSLSPGS